MTIKNFALTLAVIIALVLTTAPATAQVTMTSTTLSAAVTSSSQPGIVQVASATGIVAPSFTLPNQPTGNQTVLYVDTEEMFVTGLNGTTISVIRGYNNTVAQAHVSGAVVYVAPPNYIGQNDKYGGCTAANELALPYINGNDGKIFTCLSSGQWVQIGLGTQNPGPALSISASCYSTVGSSETEYLVPGTACSGSTTNKYSQTVSQAGTVFGLEFSSSANVVGGSSVDVGTLMINGTASALTCTISAAAKTCNDSTHSVAVAAGALLSFRFVTAGSDTASQITASVRFN